MVSFDTIGLFTCIPSYLVIDIVAEKWPILSGKWTALDEESFFEALNFCLDNGYFTYNDEFYSQIHGTAMGNPLSPIVAELVLDKLFEAVAIKFGEQIKYFKKYVDDSFFIINVRIFDRLFEFMNDYYDDISFTFEKEENNCLSILDMTIIMTSNQFIFKHFHKPTGTGRIVHYNSNQPIKMKLNTINILRRTFLSSSHHTLHQEILQKLRYILQDNGYPNHIINKVCRPPINCFPTGYPPPPSNPHRVKILKRIFFFSFRTMEKAVSSYRNI